MGPALGEPARRYAQATDAQIFDAIKNGVAPDFNMVPWKDQLKDPDIWSVVNYLKSIAKKTAKSTRSTTSTTTITSTLPASLPR